MSWKAEICRSCGYLLGKVICAMRWICATNDGYVLQKAIVCCVANLCCIRQIIADEGHCLSWKVNILCRCLYGKVWNLLINGANKLSWRRGPKILYKLWQIWSLVEHVDQCIEYVGR